MTLDEAAALVRALPDAILILDAAGRVLERNEAAAALLGSGPGQPDLSSGDPERLLEYLRSCLRGSAPLPGTLFVASQELRADGARLELDGEPLVLLHLRAKREAVASFAALNEQIAALNREIAERERAERALRDSEERFRTLVSATSTLLWSAAPDGRFVAPQPAWERYTGQKWPEYADGGGLQPIHPDDRERVRDCWTEATARAEIFEESYRLWHAESRSYRRVASRAVPLRGDDGRVREWFGAIADSEDRLRVEDRLRESQKLESLGVLAGGIAHDFNNLLVGIMGNASLAADLLPIENPARPLIQETITASERAAQLTRQLLAYAGKGRFVVERIDLSRAVNEIASLVRTSIPRHVQLRLELGSELPGLEADSSQIQQLIMNLVINAGEAIPADRDGLVLVSTGTQNIDQEYLRHLGAPDIPTGRYLCLEVQDNGVGMDAATVERIFDPFFTTKFMGRGLGLAAVQGIVRGHGGVLRVYSIPNKGTTFKVLLPSAGSHQPAPVVNDQPWHGTETVMVVDDEAVVRRSVQTILERYGYRVRIAENGLEAVEALRADADVDVVLLDMSMPVMSGAEAFRHMRALRPGLKVILSSGFNEVEAIQRFSGKGLAGFVQKPYSAVKLARKIREILDRGAAAPAS